MTRVLVVGCGIVGISTAIWLQRAGFEVEIVDRAGPASGTSYGNAGVLAAGSVIPVTVPGLIRKAPRMLLDPDGPLFLRWSYLPKLLPFLRKYLGHANQVHVEHYAKSMSSLLYDTVEQHQALAKGTGAEQFITTVDYHFGYAIRAAYEADAMGWDVRRRNGHQFEVLTAEEHSQRDPIYDGPFEVVVACKNHGRISDPGGYIRALAEHFVTQGGVLTIAEVNGLIKEGARVLGVSTDQGDIVADKTVMTLGPWSGPIAKEMGLKIPFESERGYHIELVNPSAMPKAPIMVASGKFVVTPMHGRIRMAGIVEFGGLDAPASKAPIALLKRQAKELFPNITYERIDEWMGHRPTTANSLPLIGEIQDGSGLYAGFGHQHVGLTGGPRTGRILADCIAGAKPNIDLAPFSPKHYQS